MQEEGKQYKDGASNRYLERLAEFFSRHETGLMGVGRQAGDGPSSLSL